MDFGGGAPDGVSAMENFYGKHVGTVNLSCYQYADYDATFEKLRVMQAGPERAPLLQAADRAARRARAVARAAVRRRRLPGRAGNVLGFVPHPYLNLPYHLLDVAIAPSK